MSSSTTSFEHVPRSSYSSCGTSSDPVTSTTIHPIPFYDPHAPNLYPPFASQKQPLYINHTFPLTNTHPSSSGAVVMAATTAVAVTTCVDQTQDVPSLPPLSRVLLHQENSQQTFPIHKNSGNMVYTPPAHSKDRYMVQNDIVPDYHDYYSHPTLIVPSNAYTATRPSLPSPPRSVVDMPRHHHEQQKVFSFVSLAGVNQKKRPRRKFHEIERVYQCQFSGCEKSYGTLNHLNSHVAMQQHGSKRHPSEFKQLREHRRKQKREQQAAANTTAQEQQQSLAYTMPTVDTPDYPGAFY